MEYFLDNKCIAMVCLDLQPQLYVPVVKGLKQDCIGSIYVEDKNETKFMNVTGFYYKL